MEKIRIGIGIDCGSKHLQCSISKLGNGHLKELSNKKFNNTKSGFEKIENWIHGNVCNGGVEIVMLLEVTGVYHEDVLSYFYKKGYHISVMMPSRVKSYFVYKGYESKTDKEDARGLSMMVCCEQIERWRPSSEEILEIRTLMRLRKMFVSDKTRAGNRLHALKRSTVKAGYARKSLTLMIKQLGKQIKKIEMQVKGLVNKDSEMADKIKRIVKTSQGLGFTTVVTVIAEANGFEFFTSIKQLENYAGLNIVERKSGKYEGKPKISKKGNTYLRSSMYMASLSVVKHKYEPYYGLYSRINKEYKWKIKGKGLVAVQRKLLGLIYTLWKKGEAFDPEYYKRKKNMPALQPT